MSTPLLATKLHIPPLRRSLVPRPRLIERLNEGLRRTPGMTLISAPAGFGKTTLLSEWAAGVGEPIAWLSLDGEDNDPARFLTYLLAALQQIDSGIGETAQLMSQAPQPPATQSLLTSLINDLASVSFVQPEAELLFSAKT